ncbi:MAG: InlB B-repeat-containing protein [Clostridiales Family XIII bacterium]|jgi:uncharacterized repeat protein (TIGR02543 family)|nr:InlB B-repeat-containing protein [Clostridiales Family XIII bacterium]
MKEYFIGGYGGVEMFVKSKNRCRVLVGAIVASLLLWAPMPFAQPAYADPVDVVDIGAAAGDIIITISGSDIIAVRDDGSSTEVARAAFGAGLTLTGSSNNSIFRIQGAGTFNLILSSLTMSLNNVGKPAPIYIGGASTVNLKLAGLNTLSNANPNDGVIEVDNPSSTLKVYADTIGSGELSIGNAGSNAAWIGSRYEEDAGDILIQNCTIEASTSNPRGGAIIGSGVDGDAGNITLSGAHVSFSSTGSSNDGAVIGSGAKESAASASVGNISVSNSEITAYSSNPPNNGAVIGSGKNAEAGTITVTNSDITADIGGGTGYEGAAGIGSGSGGDVGNITINGRSLDIATANGAGIGSGAGGAAGDISILGGTIYSYADRFGAGIGSGKGARVGAITISRGEINSHGYAGIGSGYEGIASNISITNGTLSASPVYQNLGAGIGSGKSATVGAISISGGVLEASSIHGAGIGSGEDGYAGNITISGGVISAEDDENPGGGGSAIGSGRRGKAGVITISGGTIYASRQKDNNSSSSVSLGAGIGSGESGEVKSILITGGNVGAYTEGDGASIGSGKNGKVDGKIEISAGTVYAESYGHGAGIGSGRGGTVTGNILVSGGNVYAHSENSVKVGAGTGGTVSGTVRVTLPVMVYFNTNGGGVAPAAHTYYYGDNYAGLSTSVKRKGYSFIGWFTESRGGTQIKNGTKMLMLGAHTLYAHWKTNLYTVHFDANGGKVTPKSKNVVFDGDYGDLPTPTWADHVFSGWYTAEKGGSRVTKNSIYQIGSNSTLYAHWLKQYTVVFDPMKGKVSKKSKIVTSTATFGSLPTPKRKGYTFQGWYTKKTGGKKVTSKTKVTIKKNIILYAHWLTKRYTVVFIVNKGNSLPASKISKRVSYNKKFGKLPKATRKGHTFLGWYTKKSGGKKITAKTKVTLKKNLSLYAHWRAKQYTVTFSVNKGKKLSAQDRSKRVTYGKKYGSLPTASRKGYKFRGWYTQKSGGERISSKSKVVITKKTKLYAQWQKKKKKK